MYTVQVGVTASARRAFTYTHRVIKSLTGVRQGAPLSSLLFDLAFLLVTRAVRAACAGQGDIVGVHDDLIIIGPPGVMARALVAFNEALPALELKSNTSKIQYWCSISSDSGTLSVTGPVENQQAFHDRGFHVDQVQAVHQHLDVQGQEDARAEALALAKQQDLMVIAGADGVMVAGSAVGCTSFVNNKLDESMDKTNTLAEGIVNLAKHHLQTAALHRYCLISRTIHLFRSMSPRLTKEFAVKFDTTVLQTYKQIIGLTYTEGAFARTEAQEELLDRQLVAPTSQGGMGFKSMQEVAPMCHVAAHFLAAPLVATATGLGNYTACVRKPSAELCEVELDLKHALELIQDEVVGEEEDPNALDLWQCTVDRLVGATTEAVPGMQKQLIEDASTRLLVGQTPHAAGRIICLGGKYATAWLRAVPSDFKYTMSSEEFQVASLAMLGFKIF